MKFILVCSAAAFDRGTNSIPNRCNSQDRADSDSLSSTVIILRFATAAENYHVYREIPSAPD